MGIRSGMLVFLLCACGVTSSDSPIDDGGTGGGGGGGADGGGIGIGINRSGTRIKVKVLKLARWSEAISRNLRHPPQ
jgi:hypothetical protein